jgi:RNA polymerase sigma factor (sigma-70 family)
MLDMDEARPRFDIVFLTQRATLVRQLTRLLGCAHTAEDLVQEAYLKIAEALRANPIRHLQPFLYSTARHLALDHLRHRRVEARTITVQTDEPTLAALVHPRSGPEESACRLEEIERLSHAIERLPPRRREILILYKLHGFTHEEIAARFGICKSAVQKHVFAALAVCLQATDDPPP